MAKGGTKAKSRKQHDREGTRNATHHRGRDLSTGSKGIGAMPQGLPPVARTFWKRAKQYLEQMGIAEECDAFHLEQAAWNWYRLREANKTILKEGSYVYNKRAGKPSRHPAAIEADKLNHQLRVWFDTVGFTPAGRASLGGGKLNPATATEDPDAGLEAEVFGDEPSGKPDLKVS